MKTDEFFEMMEDERDRIIKAWNKKTLYAPIIDPKQRYEQVLGGGFREVREEECQHMWCGMIGRSEMWCCLCGVGKDRFTDEELDFVRAFNSRQG